MQKYEACDVLHFGVLMSDMKYNLSNLENELFTWHYFNSS